MTEYIKFWLSKDLYEIGVGVSIIFAIVIGLLLLVYVIDPLVDSFKRWQRKRWKRRDDDG